MLFLFLNKPDMEKTKEELNKHFWHRLYKVILWAGSILPGLFFAAVLYPQTFESFLVDSAVFLPFFFILIFIVYRLILYIVFGGKFFFDKKDRNLFIKLLIGFVIIIVVVITWNTYQTKKREANQRFIDSLVQLQKAECKKNLLKEYYDPNMYLKDIDCCYVIGQKKEVLIDAMAFLTGKTLSSVQLSIQQEWNRLSNKIGWQQMVPLKLKDFVGDINLDSLDYTNPNFLASYCNTL